MNLRSYTLLLFSIFGLVASAPAEEVSLVVLTELTGAGAAIGEECRYGIDIAVSTIDSEIKKNGHSLNVSYSDSEDSARTAISEFNRLSQTNKADVILVTRSKIAMPLNPLSKKSGLPIVGVVAHPDFTTGNPYSVRVYPNSKVEGSFLASNVFTLGKRKIAIVTLEDEWNLATSKAFIKEFTRLGGKVVYEETIAPEETELGAIVTALKRTRPDSVFMNLQLAQGGSFVKKLREQGVDVQLFSNFWIQKSDVIDVAGIQNVEGAFFGEVNSKRPEYQKRLKHLFPTLKSSPAAYLCYVGVGSIIHALGKTPKAGGKEGFVKNLTTLNSVRLLDDEIPFIDREIQYPLRLKTLKQGKVVDAKSAY